MENWSSDDSRVVEFSSVTASGKKAPPEPANVGAAASVTSTRQEK